MVLAFQEAAQQCKSQSKGHLVAFEQIDELQRLKQFLQMHVVANIRKFTPHLDDMWPPASSGPLKSFFLQIPMKLYHFGSMVRQVSHETIKCNQKS